MGIWDIFRKHGTNEYTVYNLNAVEDFFLHSKKHLNPKDGPDFVSGIRGAYVPISNAVSKAVGRELEYGDTLRKYCEITANNPEERIKILMNFAAAMKPVPASGVRFLVGQLILHYYSLGALREEAHGESLLKQAALTEDGVSILNAFSKYG